MCDKLVSHIYFSILQYHVFNHIQGMVSRLLDAMRQKSTESTNSDEAMIEQLQGDPWQPSPPPENTP